MLDSLHHEAEIDGVEVRYHRFASKRIRGLYVDGVITLNPTAISSQPEMLCILAEELGHHFTSSGIILDQNNLLNRKQELRARRWSYHRLIPLERILEAYKARVKGRFEIADYLGVTEEFLQQTIDRYKEKYGVCVSVDDQHILYFEPLGVLELFPLDNDNLL
ncbi:uncharacterized protein DUF955 [Paenibacillus cellulosilyticus]|uniref:Uncharacterized protein DUF955 n=1 Tax=Paenibacillus cellulosilyticus TaxID=375489 RepID=A0A2V2YP63_9BACL|nr:ImmA/IrrE family metallo-endopeptidase [Paenibacillus cellulosilyticus]PWV97475.1 uncharacterized protein DUF955 [Paenibacillus cellulosilyticus]QKS48488.1 ImmA/IrrE family metallo-endopeptidase [Paenibacillus cellulosilyticus]